MKEHINILWEWVLTFSNRAGLLSSKRIERFLILSSMLSVTLFYLIKGIYNWDISAGDLTMLVVTWLGYGGFTTTQIRKDQSPPATVTTIIPGEMKIEEKQ